jgi:hypothetical protein
MMPATWATARTSPFGGAAVANEGGGFGLHGDAAGGDGDAAGIGLGADVDDAGAAGVVEVGQVRWICGHWSTPGRAMRQGLVEDLKEWEAEAGENVLAVQGVPDAEAEEGAIGAVDDDLAGSGDRRPRR